MKTALVSVLLMLIVSAPSALAQQRQFGERSGIVEVGRRVDLSHDTLDLAASADRHGRLVDDHRIALQMRRHLAHRIIDVTEVGLSARAPCRRADGDEDRVGRSYGAGEISSDLTETMRSPS